MLHVEFEIVDVQHFSHHLCIPRTVSTEVNDQSLQFQLESHENCTHSIQTRIPAFDGNSTTAICRISNSVSQAGAEMGDPDDGGVIDIPMAQAVPLFPPRPDAYITLLTTDDHLPGAQTLLYSIKVRLEGLWTIVRLRLTSPV